MVGFWPHPRYAKYHSKETPCKEKLNLHGNTLVYDYDYEKKGNFCLENADYYNLEEFDDDYNNYNNLSFDNLYWKTKKTPYGKKVSKKVYDAEKEVFFYPKTQEIKIKNKFEPLDSKDKNKKNKDKVTTTINTKDIIFNSVLEYLSYTNKLNPGTIETLNTLYVNNVLNNGIYNNNEGGNNNEHINNNDINNNSEGGNENEYNYNYKNKVNKATNFHHHYDKNKKINNIAGHNNNNNSTENSNNSINYRYHSLNTEITLNSETFLSTEDQNDSNSSSNNKQLKQCLSTEAILSTENKNPHDHVIAVGNSKQLYPSIGSTPNIENNIIQSHWYKNPNLNKETTLSIESETNTKYKNNNDYLNKTPNRKTQIMPKKLNFKDTIDNKNLVPIKSEEVPADTDLEFLLLNSWKINADKVQTVIDKFLKGRKHKTFFCFTETKVDSLDFAPIGIKLHVKHRSKTDKRGGGLMIRHKLSNKIKMEEILVNNVDIIALEGTIENLKYRIILSYFDSSKKNQGMNLQEIGISRKMLKN